MIAYDFLLGGKLAIIKFSGKIDKNTLISFLESLFKRKETRVVEKALLDYRDAVLDIEIADVNDIVKVRLDYANVVNRFHTVHFRDHENQTILSENLLYLNRKLVFQAQTIRKILLLTGFENKTSHISLLDFWKVAALCVYGRAHENK